MPPAPSKSEDSGAPVWASTAAVRTAGTPTPAGPVPARFEALTEKVYEPDPRPLMVQEVAGDVAVQLAPPGLAVTV